MCRNSISLLNHTSSTSLCDSSLSLATSFSPPILRLSHLYTTILTAFLHRGIKIDCHYSLTQFLFFFFSIYPSLMLHASYLLTYAIYVSTTIFETTSRTTNSSVVSFNFCDAFSPCVSPGSSSFPSISGSRYVSRQRDSQAFMRISIYSGTLCILSALVEHDTGGALFDDDEYEINENDRYARDI